MGKVLGLQELLWIASLSTCLKVLLIPSYHSTDFEVHRHWLAVTHSLPLKEWYTDETSEWTLDYPPFFAWFERFLAIFASYVDPNIVDLVHGLNYLSKSVVFFQRATVILADTVLYFGLWSFCRKYSVGKQSIIYASVIFSPGLIIVDHTHFQYNGFLMGILLLSLACLKDGKDLEGGIWFAVLVCFKHLFAVAGPIYFVYLLRHYCRGSYGISKFFKLGLAVLSVVGAAFGPFVYYGQMGHVLKRLFPFGRGLRHAYLAPNVWALYNATDKALGMVLHRMGMGVCRLKAGLTGGLVGDTSSYAVLPQITPAVTAGLVLVAMLPCLYEIWWKPRQSEVVRWVAYAYTCGFMFGWHVHEKASLHFVIPMSLIALDSVQVSGDFIFLSTISYYALFPLLFGASEYPIKVLLLVLYTFGLTIILHSHHLKLLSFCNVNEVGERSSQYHKDVDKVGKRGLQYNMDAARNSEVSNESQTKDHCQTSQQNLEMLGTYRRSYMWGLVVIEIYGRILHRFLFKDHLPFIPLLLISVYCAFGLVYVWTKQLTYVISQYKVDCEAF